MSDFEIFEAPNFLLQKGGILPTARLAYATRGVLSAARDNAVLVPSWYTGTHDDSEMFMLGEGRALDPGRYFIILTNLLANGLSSSPSNSPPPVERGGFPASGEGSPQMPAVRKASRSTGCRAGPATSASGVKAS